MSRLPFDFDRREVLRELAEFQQRLSRGAATLADIEEIDVGPTPRDEVAAREGIRLYRYRPLVSNPHPVPLLIVYALVNRPYMVDLQPDRSLVRKLLEAGIDVYLVDWGYPTAADRYRGLDDYVDRYLRHCVDVVRHRHRLPAIDLLGICQGGTLSLCFTALYPERVRNLVTMVTPVDFHASENLLAHFVRHIDVDLLVETFGNIPGELLNWAFLSLKPFRLSGQKYLELLDILDDRRRALDFLRMERWIFDSPDQPGEMFRDFVKGFFQENRLVGGDLQIGGRPVSLAAIRQPLLNIYATRDHVVPPAASLALGDHVGSEDYTVRAFHGGHIGIYVSARAQNEVPPVIADWLRQH